MNSPRPSCGNGLPDPQQERHLLTGRRPAHGDWAPVPLRPGKGSSVAVLPARPSFPVSSRLLARGAVGFAACPAAPWASNLIFQAQMSRSSETVWGPVGFVAVNCSQRRAGRSAIPSGRASARSVPWNFTVSSFQRGGRQNTFGDTLSFLTFCLLPSSEVETFPCFNVEAFLFRSDGVPWG